MTSITQEIVNFSQGLDLVSSLDTMPPGYTPSAINFRIAQYGGIEKILGYSAFADLGTSATDLYYFTTRDEATRFLIAATATKWKSVDEDGTVVDIRTGMSTETDSSFVMYEDLLYGLGSANALYKWTGTGSAAAVTGTNVPTGGILLGVWQNQLYYSPTANPERVIWSAPGDFTNFPTDNFVDLGGAGESNRVVAGQPISDGIVVFCKGSTFIIYDSSTGANNVVDPKHGTSSRRSISLAQGVIYGVNHDGIFSTNGRFPLTIVSERIDPLFRQESPVLGAAAGVEWFGAYLLSFGRNGNATNNQTLDLFVRKYSRFDRFESVMLNEYRAAAWASGPINGDNQQLFFVDGGNKRYIRSAFDSGAYLSTATPGVASNINAYYETPPLNFGTEVIKRLRRVRLVGHGSALNLAVKVDYSLAQSISKSASFSTGGSAVWGSSDWDESTWGGYFLSQSFVRLPARGRRFALRFSDNSQAIFPGRDIIGSGISGLIGGCGVYQIEPEFTLSSRRI